MENKANDESLTADDVECLWAIARRATIQDRLVQSRGSHLEKQGLIELTHEWPTLTPKGLKVIKDLSAQAILNLHRDQHDGD